MEVGDTVEWENGSYILTTGACGEIAAIHDSYVVIRRPDMVERYPHLCPFVTKRIWELRSVEARLAA